MARKILITVGGARLCSESESVFERKMEELDGSSSSVTWKRFEDDE